MTDKRVWFITGAGRGMGVDFAKAALVAGNAVVATGRNPDAVRTAVGDAEDLLVVKLDVAKFGLEGWMESLQDEVAPLAMSVTGTGSYGSVDSMPRT